MRSINLQNAFIWIVNKAQNKDIIDGMTNRSQDKMDLISQMTFSNSFHVCKLLHVDSYLTEIYSEGPNYPSLFQKMFWHWIGNKPLSEPMMA